MNKFIILAAALWLACANAFAQVPRPPRPQPQAYFWAGMQLGSYGREMAGMELSLSAQPGRGGYGSVYWLGASTPFSAGDQLSEYGFMAGPCARSRGAFAGAAIGLGVVSGWFGAASRKTASLGVPFKAEGSVIIGGFLALNLQLRGFLWKRTHGGISLGLQLGKMR